METLATGIVLPDGGNAAVTGMDAYQLPTDVLTILPRNLSQHARFQFSYDTANEFLHDNTSY